MLAGSGSPKGSGMASERYRAPADWSEEQVAEAVWLLRLGRSCAQVADCMRVFDEVVVRIGWALRATGVDVQGLAVARRPQPARPQLPVPAIRRPRLPAVIIGERRREEALVLS